MRSKSIGVHFDLDTNVIVRGSFYELQQVVTNLLLNAKDAVPDRGNIWINVKTNGSTATLEVRDDGRGIPLEVIGRIFKPLVTTKRNTGGTGLGLAIAERIVQAHGGNIRVESKPEQGATFLITLPLLVGTERT
jgi:signal transduction histidine kinase